MLRARNLSALATLLLVLVGPACDKDGKTRSPGEGGSANNAAGETLRYKAEARTLTQRTHYEFTISGGGQFGEAKADLVGTIQLEPMGSDKLKVAWKVSEVPALELKGVLKPKDEAGKPPPPDPKQVLLEKGGGAFVMDLRGETDKDATKALPENEAKRKEREERKKQAEAEKAAGGDKAKKTEGAKKDGEGEEPEMAADDRVLAFFGNVFQMPSLPKLPLEVGKSTKVEEQNDLPLGGEDGGGPKLPIESESTFNLVRIDQSGGKRIAEIEFEVEASGATEFQGGMLVVDQSTEGTMMFNLDDGVPVSLQMTSSQSFAVGDQGQEVMTVVKSTFEPAGST